MRYDPERAPNATQWLASDESERITAVSAYHRRAKIAVPNEDLHAIVHVIVENQLAMGLEHVTTTATRLQSEGLSRHDTIHAIASVLSGLMLDMLKAGGPWSAAINDQYIQDLAALTASGWLASADDA